MKNVELTAGRRSLRQVRRWRRLLQDRSKKITSPEVKNSDRKKMAREKRGYDPSKIEPAKADGWEKAETDDREHHPDAEPKCDIGEIE